MALNSENSFKDYETEYSKLGMFYKIYLIIHILYILYLNFLLLDDKIQNMIDLAIKARLSAYIPISKFAVGAAICSEEGKIYTGCNIENSAQTSTCCAERCAYFKAISEGVKNISKVVVVAVQDNKYVSPCGVCRQVIQEFARFSKTDILIYMARDDHGKVLVSSLNNLLPYGFVLD